MHESHGGGALPLAGADPMRLAYRLLDGNAVERALALAAIIALL